MMTYLCALALLLAVVVATSNAFMESPSMTRHSRTKLFSSEESVAFDSLDETLLRINFSVVQGAGLFESYANNALEAVRSYTQSFPFAAVLPVQPLTYLPVTMSDGSPALKVTFLRKKMHIKFM